MGGRGSVSVNGKTISFGAGGNLGGPGGLAAPEQRAGIRSALQALGFRDAYNTTAIEQEVMDVAVQALTRLEGKYGAIGGSVDPVLNGVETDAIAYVTRMPGNASDQTLNFSLKNMGNADQLASDVAAMQQKGWFMQTGKSRGELLAYTVNHEYGHMVENMLHTKSGTTKSLESWAVDVKADIESRAAKYGGGTMSTYGSKNAREFFAEAFASSQGGTPDAYGKAMLDFLAERI